MVEQWFCGAKRSPPTFAEIAQWAKSQSIGF